MALKYKPNDNFTFHITGSTAIACEADKVITLNIPGYCPWEEYSGIGKYIDYFLREIICGEELSTGFKGKVSDIFEIFSSANSTSDFIADVIVQRARHNPYKFRS